MKPFVVSFSPPLKQQRQACFPLCLPDDTVLVQGRGLRSRSAVKADVCSAAAGQPTQTVVNVMYNLPWVHTYVDVSWRLRK